MITLVVNLMSRLVVYNANHPCLEGQGDALIDTSMHISKVQFTDI